MKYTTENALSEIKRRAKRIKQKYDRRILNILTTCASFSLITIIAVISSFSNGGVCEMQTEYGAFILPTNGEKHFLVAIVNFVMGITTTFTIKHLKKGKNHEL